MRPSKRLIGFGIVLPLAAAIFWIIRNSRAVGETARYRVLLAEGDFELRDYPSLTLARTRMDAGSDDGSFTRLFRFISGANAGGRKIAMTTPVLIDAGGDGQRMSFIMPHAAVASAVPQPTGRDVTLDSMESGTYAVLRFKGARRLENENHAVEALRARLPGRGLEVEGGPMFAYYDPPWTPYPLRRNEVLLRVAATAR